MAIVVSILGALIALIGVVGITQPQRLISLVEHWNGPSQFTFAVVIRVVLGVVLLVAAPECRLPTVVRVIGWITIVAALSILIIGRARLDSFIAWWLGRPGLLRLSAILSIAFGVLLIYAGA